jgi:HEAT repeat protein
MLKKERDENRRAAAEALGKLGEVARPAIPALVEALVDSDEFLRYNAAEALGNVAQPGDRIVIAALGRALRDRYKEVPKIAAASLKKLQQE